MVAKGDSNPGSLDCESGILSLSYRAPVVRVVGWVTTQLGLSTVQAVATAEVGVVYSEKGESKSSVACRNASGIYMNKTQCSDDIC